MTRLLAEKRPAKAGPDTPVEESAPDFYTLYETWGMVVGAGWDR